MRSCCKLDVVVFVFTQKTNETHYNLSLFRVTLSDIYSRLQIYLI